MTRVLLHRNGTALVLKIFGGLLSHHRSLLHNSEAQVASRNSCMQFVDCGLLSVWPLAFHFCSPLKLGRTTKEHTYTLFELLSLSRLLFSSRFFWYLQRISFPPPPPLGFDLKSDDGGHCSPVEPVCSGVFRINCEEKASSSSTGGE